MKSKDALRVLAEITAYQWGMVTSAQARTHGITRLDLSRLAADGQLERAAHGVYRDAGAPAGPHDDLKAAWLSTVPTTMGEARIKDAANGVVVAGESAADLHGIGDFRALRHEFVSPARRQSQRTTIRYRRRMLAPRDVTLVDGLPVMTLERTIADLVEEVGDLSLVADALRDASGKRDLDFERLRSLLSPLAQRSGLEKADGAALLDRLMEIADIDADAVARRVAADESLGAKVVARYFAGLSEEDLDRFVTSLATIREAQRAVTRG
ncbi:MAG: type IV toxin-antitoxin system AbiEi family antitoxin domain-containing protein [Propionibacteriaceae bacterium]|nr:type IV toxin-antitoxin system AbiEi family antitoxin domain-containing protein [Propionibacteriaceae bacterium]